MPSSRWLVTYWARKDNEGGDEALDKVTHSNRAPVLSHKVREGPIRERVEGPWPQTQPTTTRQ